KHFVGYAVTRDRVEIERQKRLGIHHVWVDGIDKELKHYTVGKDGKTRGRQGVVVGADLGARLDQIRTDLLALDADHRLAVAHDRQVRLDWLVGIEMRHMLRIDLIGIGV